ncbi:uncharacterized protein LOC133189806 [Saccostrea echinata]|uniref:uncharacterized protein LOC133189806 n=1 Tax=Saccostrea echinata TaxID=191078 RepID=UPI002A7FDF8E|nr:uncharacterized protein LOC133189806 [Saccostrea echinata]
MVALGGFSLCAYFKRNRKNSDKNHLPSTTTLARQQDNVQLTIKSRSTALPSLKNMQSDFYESNNYEDYEEPASEVKMKDLDAPPPPIPCQDSRDLKYESCIKSNKTEHEYRGLFEKSGEFTASIRSEHAYVELT